MKKGYNDGTVKDIFQMSSQEREKAFKAFSEGNKYLRKALKTCFENGIKTIGCCKGHIIERQGRFDENTGEERKHRKIQFSKEVPYVHIKIEMENLYHIFNLMDKAFKMSNIEIVLDGDKENEALILAGKSILDRKRLFRMIEQEAKNMIHFENMLPECREFWKLHTNLLYAEYDGTALDGGNHQMIMENEKSKITSICIMMNNKILEDILQHNGLVKEDIDYNYGIESESEDKITTILTNINQEIENTSTFNHETLKTLRKGKPKEQIPTTMKAKRKSWLERLKPKEKNENKEKENTTKDREKNKNDNEIIH